MSVFLVMRDDTAPADDSLFLKDGFSTAAFYLAPVWLLRHGLWLPFVGYAAALTAIVLLSGTVGAGVVVMLLALHLFIALEGNDMRRSALEKRGYRLADVVTGSDAGEAEIRYFGERYTPPPVPERPAIGAGPWGARP